MDSQKCVITMHITDNIMETLGLFIQENVFSVRTDLDERTDIILFDSIPSIGIEQAVGLRLPSYWLWLQVAVVSRTLKISKYFVMICLYLHFALYSVHA